MDRITKVIPCRVLCEAKASHRQRRCSSVQVRDMAARLSPALCLQGGNPIYNLLPDILSGLSAQADLAPADFQARNQHPVPGLACLRARRSGILAACQAASMAQLLLLLLPGQAQCWDSSTVQ